MSQAPVHAPPPRRRRHRRGPFKVTATVAARIRVGFEPAPEVQMEILRQRKAWEDGE